MRVELANVYYDARRFDLAIPWYEAALTIDPKNVNASTDLAICYYYTNNIDRALTQIDRSLALDPRHVKSLLNQGIIRVRQGRSEWRRRVLGEGRVDRAGQ